GQCREAAGGVRDQDGRLSTRSWANRDLLGRISTETRRHQRTAKLSRERRNVRTGVRSCLWGTWHQTNDVHINRWGRGTFPTVLRFAFIRAIASGAAWSGSRAGDVG